MTIDGEKRTEDAVDLSQDDGDNGGNGGNILSQEPDKKVDLDSLTYEHRKYLFWVVLGVCLGLYVLFGVYVFNVNCLQILLDHSAFAISIALSLLIVPSTLLWGLLYSVYKNNKAEKEDFSWASLGELLGNTLKGILKVYPASH